MGNGTRTGNRLNFQISSNYSMNVNDFLRWQRAFLKASEILYNSTEGQLSFGNIFVNNNNIGVNNAEFVLDPDITGRALATFGKFGQQGEAIQLPAYAQRQVLSIIHELGHHLFALNEEYARAVGGTINKTITLPAADRKTVIPLSITDLGVPDADFTGADAILSFGGDLETRTITSKSGNQITVSPAFSEDTQTTDWNSVLVQWSAECTGDMTTGACIMEFSRSSAGNLENDGTWTPAPNPVTEFCTAHNHDPDEDTGQHLTYGVSCWDTLSSRPGFTDLASGAPSSDSAANKTAPGGYSPPNWVELTDDFRFALVLDKSGSMNKNGGSRLVGTKTGAAYWLENGAVEEDNLAIIWFNSNDDTLLSLTDFSTLTEAQVSTLVSDITSQSANGGTNIRDGLLTALNEMINPGDLAAIQTALLLTDGAHNNPSGTSMSEVIPDYQDSNANIYTLGIGTGSEMDLDGLEDLSAATGGSSFTVGDGGNVLAVQNSMIEINNLIRGGMLTAGPDTMPDMKKGDKLSELELRPELPPKKRPSMSELIEKLGFDSLEALLKSKSLAPGRLQVFIIEVEEKADSATFTLSYENHEKLWLYLVDPEGKEITPSSPETIAFISTGQPYEFSKIRNPKAGRWQVIAFRPSPGTACKVKVITGIQHKEINVYASHKAIPCGVKLFAGARYKELLTGIYCTAIIKDQSGKHYQFSLKDDHQLGEYETLALLPDGHYAGYVEVRSPGNTMLGNYQHAIMHAENVEKMENLIVKHPEFVRHIPLSFYVGERKGPIVDKNEIREIHKEQNEKRKGYSKHRK